jgi:hypothetical protein
VALAEKLRIGISPHLLVEAPDFQSGEQRLQTLRNIRFPLTGLQPGLRAKPAAN